MLCDKIFLKLVLVVPLCLQMHIWNPKRVSLVDFLLPNTHKLSTSRWLKNWTANKTIHLLKIFFIHYTIMHNNNNPNNQAYFLDVHKSKFIIKFKLASREILFRKDIQSKFQWIRCWVYKMIKWERDGKFDEILEIRIYFLLFKNFQRF